tara:strand:- start:147 stop:2291 length:2145 start_codon:yes stop_codon:yes gene_type:complete
MAGYNYQSTAGNTARFQKQNIPESQMTPDWYIKCINAIATHYNSTTFDEFAFESKPHVHKFLEYYKYYFGKQSTESLAFMQEAAPNVNLPAKWIPGKKIMSLLEYMRGSFIRVINTVNVTTFSTTKSTLDEKMVLENAMIFDLLTEPFQKAAKNISGRDQTTAGIGSFGSVEDIKEFMQYDFKTANEVIAKELADHIMFSNHHREKFIQLFTHMLITNQPVLKIYVENGQVKWRVVNPLTFTCDTTFDNEYGRDMNFAGEVRYLTVPQIVEEYQGKLTPETLQLLKAINEDPKHKALREMEERGPGYYRYNNGVLLIRVVEAEWKGIKQLGVEQNTDKYGNTHVTLSDKKKSKKYPIQCVRFGVLIGDTHLIDFGEAPNQYRKANSLADTELNYKVFMPGHMLGHDVSIVEKLHAHQDNIDLYKYKIQLAIGRDKGKVYTIDTSQLDGVNDINEIATIAQTVGIIPYNSYNDETGMSKPSGKYFDVIDLSLDGNIKNYLMLIEREVREMEEIVNIPQMALGQQQAVVGLGVQQNTIAQSTLGVLNYYDGFLKYIENILQQSVNIQKLVLDYDKTTTGVNIVGATKSKILRVTNEFRFDDFGIYIDANDMVEPAAKQRILTIAQAMAQNGLMEMLDFVKLDQMDTYTEMVNYLEQSLRLKKIEEAQKEQLQQQIQQEQQQQQMQSQERQGARQILSDQQIARENNQARAQQQQAN